MDISKDILLEIYDRMVTTRFFSERINEFFIKGIMHGTTHLSVGEEASGVASCMALDKGDYTTSTHRGHSHATVSYTHLDVYKRQVLRLHSSRQRKLRAS